MSVPRFFRIFILQRFQRLLFALSGWITFFFFPPYIYESISLLSLPFSLAADKEKWVFCEYLKNVFLSKKKKHFFCCTIHLTSYLRRSVADKDNVLPVLIDGKVRFRELFSGIYTFDRGTICLFHNGNDDAPLNGPSAEISSRSRRQSRLVE